jgi:GAF domain-containing protein
MKDPMPEAIPTPAPDEAPHVPPAEGADPAAHAFAGLAAETGGVLESMEQVNDYLTRDVHAVRRHVDGCDEVGVTLMSDGRPHTAAYTTVNTLEVDSLQYAVDEGPCLAAARTGIEQVASMSEAHKRWPAFAAGARADGVRSLLAIPLVSGDESVGALNLYGWAGHAFDDFDASVARFAAARVAEAVVAVTALDGARRLAGQLEQAMASRAVIEQAKGVLMATRRITEHEAFELIRRTSQDTNVKVRDLAARIVAATGRTQAEGDAVDPLAPAPVGS